MRRSAIALVLLCAIAGVLAATTMAHTKSYSGNLTLNISGFSFSGVLSSGFAACEKNRYVVVYSVGPTGLTSSAASDYTDGAGNWKTPQGFVDAGGEYVARIAAKTLLNNGQHKHKCKPVVKRRNFGA